MDYTRPLFLQGFIFATNTFPIPPFTFMKSLNNLTVGEYQELYKIHKSKDDELEKSIQSVAVITGKTRWEVEEMDLTAFNEQARIISILFSTPVSQTKPKLKVKVNGKNYRVCLNPRKISFGQYVDIQHFLKGNMIDNLHKLFACILVPYKFMKQGKYDGANHEQIAEGVLSMNFQDIHSTCVFFLNLWNRSIEATVLYLKNQWNKEMKETSLPFPEAILQSITDGSTMLSQ